MNHTLSISNLSCQYEHQTVLDCLSLTVNKGEIICLLGSSGCGKTTLLKAIAGLLPIKSGSIKLNHHLLDDRCTQVAPEQRNIGMIFQDYALFPHLTVVENIAFGLRKVTAQEKKQRIEQMLTLVQLDGYTDRYPHQLSGGQQQRVAIARSLAYQPDLLLLDEPFSNIDTQVRHELIREIRDIFKRQGVTAIFVTHSREEAFAFADKMAVMNKGRIEQFGTASELYHHPSCKFVADFLGGGSYLPATKSRDNDYLTSLGTVQADSPSALTIEQQCVLLMRPYSIILQSDSGAETQVEEQQFKGDQCHYIVNVDGNRLIATSLEPLSVGDHVAINICSKGVYAFPS
ncbi:ABC transporter ATP-binding protein [Vibrio tritonius]|uniref:ABC transporter ATP-binding protein n=1 Tax=Vibrio tritonius TaxID=1435069 RepID=A0ABS7YVD1_9VIBR|nr:ABC transporter ATP-binding protein [Vibrio tritonius]MCA2018846.1 ABC transporter ATP-binding protein [Vibrio tritonius]